VLHHPAEFETAAPIVGLGADGTAPRATARAMIRVPRNLAPHAAAHRHGAAEALGVVRGRDRRRHPYGRRIHRAAWHRGRASSRARRRFAGRSAPLPTSGGSTRSGPGKPTDPSPLLTPPPDTSARPPRTPLPAVPTEQARERRELEAQRQELPPRATMAVPITAVAVEARGPGPLGWVPRRRGGEQSATRRLDHAFRGIRRGSSRWGWHAASTATDRTSPANDPELLAAKPHGRVSHYEGKAAIIPAVLLAGLNSDVPGPLIAQVASGLRHRSRTTLARATKPGSSVSMTTRRSTDRRASWSAGRASFA
jgi:hypothetical protein